ncbi:MAG: hypothetical protein DSY80_07810 [Desulfocapsa sp.]|nr:MAG: hypothetical protein DSY80_07810 [Desulfocapsa sp.]
MIEDYNLRKGLYARTALKVLYNPTEAIEPGYDVIDVTQDISNQTIITHFNTKEVRDGLASIKIVVTDNPLLARLLDKLPGVLVTFAYYGKVDANRTGRKKGDELKIGILNHNDMYAKALVSSRNMLNKLNTQFLMLGEVVGISDLKFNVKPEVVSNLRQFTAQVDIVLVPSKLKLLLSPTIILGLAHSGVVVLTSNFSTFDVFEKAAGVRVIDSLAPSKWKKEIKLFSKDNNALAIAIKSNQIHITRVIQNSLMIADRIERRVKISR